MTIIYSRMVNMAAPVMEHCSKARQTRKVLCNGKTNGMKTAVLQIIIKDGNSSFIKIHIQWNTIIRSTNIDFVYMLTSKSVKNILCEKVGGI